MKDISDIKPFEKKVWLSSPTMHGDELKYITEAYETNWMSTVGANINSVEAEIAEKVGCKYAVALSAGTAALHLATRLAGEKLYGIHAANEGSLAGHKVFASDMTFDATVNPIAYEGGEAVFIDTEYDTWNMDPEALAKAFELYPDVKLVIIAHLYGTPGKIDEIRKICDEHDALLIEDAAESLGAEYKSSYSQEVNHTTEKRDLVNPAWRQTSTFGDYNAISFNGNKIITGSSGGMFLTDSKADADKVRKWSTQSREAAPWYQHEEIGYNYRMSNVIAGVVRGQVPYLSEHINQKLEIYERYKSGLADLPVSMNPYDMEKSKPNFWLSCIIIDKDAMAPSVRGDREYLYNSVSGKSSPQEVLDMLAAINAEGRPIWKPMHAQPVYINHPFVTRYGNGRGQSNAYIDEGKSVDVGMDIFKRGLCLPSDNKMTVEEQEKIIKVIHMAFQ